LLFLHGNFLPFTEGYFHDRAGIIFLPLANTAGDGLDPIIRFCRNVPEQINIPSVSDPVKDWRNDHNINVTQPVGPILSVRSIDDTELNGKPPFPSIVSDNGLHGL
jgi:hypothetical protein